jgi:hypothetical protein
LLIQYLSISAAVIRAGVETNFHLDFKFSIYSKISSLIDSEICLLSQNGDSSFFESLLIGQTSHTKRGPARGHLHASSKYIVNVCFFINILTN